MKNKSEPQSNSNSFVEELIHSLIHDLWRPTNNGLARSELFNLDIPLSESDQQEFYDDISRQFKEISRLLKEYQQRLQDRPR